MIRVFHVNLRTLWIYRRILARLATSNVSELPFSSTVTFFPFLSLNMSSNIIAHNLNLIQRKGRKRLQCDLFKIASQFRYFSLVIDRRRTLSETVTAVHILLNHQIPNCHKFLRSFFLLPENDSTAERSSVAKLHRASSGR